LGPATVKREEQILLATVCHFGYKGRESGCPNVHVEEKREKE
jgi:hypothetical protein